MKKRTSTTKKISTENKKVNPLFIFAIIAFIVLVFIFSKILISNKNNNTEVKNTSSLTTNEKTVQRELNTKDKDSVLKLMSILSSEEQNDNVLENAFSIIKKENLDINTTDNNGKTVLMYAAFYDNSEIIDSLIKKGVDINKIDNEGRTALHWAAYYGKEEAVKTLLKNGASKNIKDKLGNTAFDLSEFEGYENITDVLK